MNILGVDCETTGFDVKQERITELGYVVWDTEKKTPLLIEDSFLFDTTYTEKFTPEVVEMMERVCGITPQILQEWGRSPKEELDTLEDVIEKHNIKHIVAHNGNAYDRPLLMAEMARNDVPTPFINKCMWLDTLVDIPFKTQPDSRKLKYLACDHGFMNPFAHRAVFDVLTMLTLLSQYNIEEVIAYSRIPSKIIRALVSYDDREKAKSMKYMWEKCGDKTFAKCWVKVIKEDKVAAEIEACKKQGFQAVAIA
jgi:DNA polymerase III epsilon subunit-like protein